MLALSDNAVREIKELTETGGLRFVAREGEDGDWLFDPSVEDEPLEGDTVVEHKGARVFLDALAAEKLADQILEIHSHGDHLHLDFVSQSGGEGEPEGETEGDSDDGSDGPIAA
jgi:Fe-S cluster assembly iron-binding protein IscA